MIKNVATDVSSARKVAKKLKTIAEKHILDENESPPLQHWALFPGKTRVCFAQHLCEDGLWCCLSVSAPYGRPSDLMIFALLKLFDAPPKRGRNSARNKPRCTAYHLAGECREKQNQCKLILRNGE